MKSTGNKRLQCKISTHTFSKIKKNAKKNNLSLGEYIDFIFLSANDEQRNSDIDSLMIPGKYQRNIPVRKPIIHKSKVIPIQGIDLIDIDMHDKVNEIKKSWWKRFR